MITIVKKIKSKQINLKKTKKSNLSSLIGEVKLQ